VLRRRRLWCQPVIAQASGLRGQTQVCPGGTPPRRRWRQADGGDGRRRSLVACDPEPSCHSTGGAASVGTHQLSRSRRWRLPQEDQRTRAQTRADNIKREHRHLVVEGTVHLGATVTGRIHVLGEAVVVVRTNMTAVVTGARCLCKRT